MRQQRCTILALPFLLAVLLSACAAEDDAPPASDAPPATAPASEPAAAADSDGPAAAWSPPGTTDGELPRTLAGFTLLDPEPEGSSEVKGVVFTAARQLDLQRPDGYVRVYSFGGKIFRIERTLPAGTDYVETAQAARDAYGQPSDDGPSRVQFGDSLGVGDTILEVRELGESVQVFIEDAGTALKAHSAS